MALLHIVERVETLQVALLVGKVHHVPVELAVGLGRGKVVVQLIVAGLLVLGRLLAEVPHVVCRAGQLLVVVGARVGGIAVPSECRGAVLAVLHGHGGGEAAVFVYVEVPGEDACGFEGVDHACIALHTVLIAPVGVVVVGAGQCVGLLGGGALLGTLGGHGEEAHREAVTVVELLLGTEETAERVVEGALDDAFVGPAVGE